MADFPGVATLIPTGVTFLDPEERVFEAKPEGWKQRVSLWRHQKRTVAGSRIALLVVDYCN